MESKSVKTGLSQKETDSGSLRVGITGGLGSGKSVVCGMFRDLGIRVFEADTEAKRLMEADGALRRKIVSAFGEKSYHADGTLNRQALAESVFSDPVKRKKLEVLVHPRVREKMRDFFAAGNCSDYAIVEAALVYESGLDRELDYVVVIDADINSRIERAVQRGDGTRENVRARINAQMPAAEKREKADFTIINDGTLDELRDRVRFIHILLQGFALKRGPTSTSK